ncbi:MAG TPA: RsmD family RNA methyltransferase, partial [bacterium]|nr:RsmD family RNA methyltransferase [bacterium]
MAKRTSNPTMTVLAGDLKGASVSVPESPLLRPTLARVREAVFDIWQFQVEGATFVDGFAGSGIMGLEALSRGAARVITVEKQTRNARRIMEQMKAIATRWGLKGDFALRWELRTAAVEQAVLDLVAEGVEADLV